jgi:hypothetical protein
MNEWKPKRVTNWRKVALEMLRKTQGRRCVKCSFPVEEADAVLYRISRGEYMIKHKNCEKIR